MWGIIGDVGNRAGQGVFFDGLNRLECRGRDSPGLARSNDGQIERVRAARNLEALERLASSQFFLYLGRLSGPPVALDGAPKLKEISYVPTDAYAAAEMKHGPIALFETGTPVICVATETAALPELLSNLSEVRARGARVLAVASEGCKEIAEHAEHIVYVPSTDPPLQVLLAILPLQLFAYHLARARALNVNQSRNLAKSVTVE